MMLFYQHFNKNSYNFFDFHLVNFERNATKKETKDAVKRGKHYSKTPEARQKGIFYIPGKGVY